MHRILLSNDDGYQAQGLAVLAAALADSGEIIVVAPDRDRSAASNSLTLTRPLRATQAANGFHVVDGTPTDCVHLAITGLLASEPDMVISGINHGANLGDDVLYSGTVAAAMEGRHLGLPAVAVSLASRTPTHFETAGEVIRVLLPRFVNGGWPSDTILNVNVPDRPFAQIAGFAITRLGHRHKAEPVIAAADPQGRPIYWVGPAGAAQDAGPGTDFHAIEHGLVSITPIHTDLTRHGLIEPMREWLAEWL